MHKKLILLILLIISAPLFASELLIGVEAGYNYNIINTTTGWEGTSYRNGHGFDVAIPIEYRVNNWFSLSTGIRWVMRSSEYTKISKELNVNFVDDYTLMHHAIDIPLTLRFSLPLNSFRIFVGGGAYIGVRTFDFESGSTMIQVSDSLGRYFWDDHYSYVTFEADDNLFDAGLIAELGASYDFENYGSFYLLGRYQYGLTSLAKDSYMASHTYFDSISVDAGFAWRII